MAELCRLCPRPCGGSRDPRGGALLAAQEFRDTIAKALRNALPEITSAMYRAYDQGRITEAEAEELQALIEARKVIPAAPSSSRKSKGSRPRSPASIERRRRWAASGGLPVALASRFTLAEQAVLAVVAGEVARHGRCTLHIGHIAALAGVCETTVRNALREARHLELIDIERRPLTHWRNLSNRVTIVSPEWLAWLRLGGRGGAYKFAKGSGFLSQNREGKRPADPLESGIRREGGGTLAPQSSTSGGFRRGPR